MTDYRQLCAELIDELEGWVAYGWEADIANAHVLIDRARAALAEPESASLEQGVQQMQPFVVRHYTEDERPTIKGNGFDGLEIGEDREEAEAFVAWINEKLARLGNHPTSPDSSTPQPIPVTERPPGDQLCWWFEDDEECGYGSSWTLLRIRGCTTAFTHWLPANALPQPS